MKKNGQKGQALPLVMIAIVLGALVLPPFLGHVDSSIIGSKSYEGMLYGQYACDSGAEHAIWSLTDGDIAADIPNPGDVTSYQLPESVNDLTANVTVCNSYQILAEDDFNSGGWMGGSGWLGDWANTGEAAVTNMGMPYEGAYHLRLKNNVAEAKRAVDLSQDINVYLDFWAKAEYFENNATADCKISSDGITWTTVHTWTANDNDGVYHHRLISLAPYQMSGWFWISFNMNIGNTGGNFYVDKLRVIWLASAQSIAASDDFESGDETGGPNWLDSWNLTGDAVITTEGSPYEGGYHLRLRTDRGIAKRSLDLSHNFLAAIQLWAKIDNFEAGDKATCQVSSDGESWTTVYTWTDAVDDNTYHLYTIDLAGFEFTNQFWISFHANMDEAEDYFYVDNVAVEKISGYGIAVTAGDTALKAVVGVDEAKAVKVLFWSFV